MYNPTSVTNVFYKNKWMIMKQLHIEIEKFFLFLKDYNFQRQVDLVLLFIVYHCIDNIKTSALDKKIKEKEIKNILENIDVCNMFSRIKINSLNISWKLKIITFIYKYRIKALFYL